MAEKSQNKIAEEKIEGMNENSKSPNDEELKQKDIPFRPSDLRESLTSLYLCLAIAVVGFVGISFLLSYKVPDGMFELKDGTLIPLNEFDPVKHGPYPSCHPYQGKHLAQDGITLVDNSEISDPGPFPIGHPQNPEWLEIVAKTEEKVSLKSIQPSLHLLILAALTVLVGCKHAVWMYTKPGPNDDDDGKQDTGQSTMQDADAYKFPILGSFTLFALFILYEFLDAEWLKFLFSVYVVIMCGNGLGLNISHYVALRGNTRTLYKYKAIFNIPYFNHPVTYIDVLSFITATILGVVYIRTKNWIVNNIMALSFSILALKLIGLSSYKTGAILLVGLFFYDVFWVFGSKSVFGSNVMVAVAKGIEAPILLKFPRGQDGCGKMTFSMLGLGDIVIPGIFIGLLAKWDVKRQKSSTEHVTKSNFLYLNSGML